MPRSRGGRLVSGRGDGVVSIQDTDALMGGRIAALALGRRSRWVVIGAWVVLALALAPLQPKLQTIASDESETFFARGADSTQVDRLLDTRFPEGRDATAVIAFVAERGLDLRAHGRDRADVDKLCARETLPALKGVGGPDGAACGELGHVLGPETPPSAVLDRRARERWCCLGRQRPRRHRVGRRGRRRAAQDRCPGRTASPLRSYVTGPAGFDADRSAAVEGIDGTLLAITGALVLRADAARPTARR